MPHSRRSLGKLIFLFFFIPYFHDGSAQGTNHESSRLKPNFQAYEALHIPAWNKEISKQGVIKVAVIDNGFNVNHQCIKAFIYHNPDEIAGNGKDDDGNGYVDDISGWDIADHDNNVSIPLGREDFFYHGTMIAGAITQVAERCFGSKASSLVKIVPVKVLADQSVKSNYELGYDGIEYAIRSKVDIIICAWSGGRYDDEKYGHLFKEAEKKGILILGSAGNFYSEQCDPPSSIASVYVVSAVDSAMHKLKTANYGRKVDLCAPGEYVYAPHPAKDNGYGYNDGTSAAVSLVGGCAAILKVLNPAASPEVVIRALKNTAIPVDGLNTRYGGKLGAGFPDMQAACRYLLGLAPVDSFFNSSRPEGDIIFDKRSSKTTWELSPAGGIKGFYINPTGNWKDRKTPVRFFSGETLLSAYKPSEFPVNAFFPGNKLHIEYNGKRGSSPALLHYEVASVDSTRLFCSDTRYYENSEGEISDGSGPQDYANNCACKWQITVPAGKRIKVVFDQLKTQAKIDYVTIFEGTGTLPENILGSFSGPDLPPVIVSGSNQVLIWFVTDDTVTDEGWHLHYQATDEAPGILPPPKPERK